MKLKIYKMKIMRCKRNQNYNNLRDFEEANE